MNIETKKIELIDWIAQLNDQLIIQKIMMLKKNLIPKEKGLNKRIYGSGKHLVEFVADDFNDPIDFFEAYQK